MRDRIPPGQVVTTKWPVLHYGNVPSTDPATWTFTVSGLVERPFAIQYDELLQLPMTRVVCDIHCVTTWRRLHTTLYGVGVLLMQEPAVLLSSAPDRLVFAEQ